MSSGIVIFRALSKISISKNLKYSSSRVVAAVHQIPSRLYCAEHAKSTSENEIDPKDRSVKIPVETSIRYLQSRAYKATYGDDPVWVPYRRNFKGSIPPTKTRRSCIKKDRIVTGNPCPICRDEYLVLHETNVELLKQFISPYTGEILGWSQTNLCRLQFDNLMVAILRAQEEGLLTMDVPFRRYNYRHYYPNESKQQHE